VQTPVFGFGVNDLINPSTNIYGGGDSSLFDNGEGACDSTLTALVDLACTPYFL